MPSNGRVRPWQRSPIIFWWVELANVLGSLDCVEEGREALRRAVALVTTFTVDLYEKGSRLTWRDKAEIVRPMVDGLRKLEAD